MITLNSVYKYIDVEQGERIRIIELNEKFVYIVNIDAVTSMPKKELLSTIQSEVEGEKLIQINDPYAKAIDDKKLSNVQKVKRNQEWEIIQNYWYNNRELLLEKRKRGKFIQEISNKTSLNELKVKKIFSRFWQRGMTKNSLLPDYMNSGGKGKNKKLSTVKIGRPKSVDYYGNSIEGINITDNVRQQFQISIDKYYRSKNKLSLKETYNYVLRDFFSDRYKEDGKIKYKIWDKSLIPTYNQFYYWFKKLQNPKKDIIFRESKKEYNLKYRPILSNSSIETNGPGTRYQIDATIADIYLVSSLDRSRIIGRPVVYAVIDVYSRLITGIYVGLEGPLWIGAMMALDNMITDKVQFCKAYGMDIKEEQWPSHHLPEIIIADRGEFEGYCVENLINNLNVKIENTSPYRGDLKGIVERNFRTLNTKIKHKAPGAIQKEFRKRGDEDYRLDATLTLEEFEKIYINIVLHHNSKLIDKYPMEKDMIANEIIPIPTQLWNWGIENKKGRLRVVDKENFRLNILPRAKASISRAGIRFKNLYYGSKKGIEEQWFLKSKGRSIEIVYDPRNMNYIYILDDDGVSYEKCYLLEPSIQYKDCILEEIIFNQELLRELKEKEIQEQSQIDINLDEAIDSIIKNAKREKKKSISVQQSKNSKIKDIKQNRKLDKEINRISESFKIGEESSKNKAGIVKLPIKNDKNKKEELTGNARLMAKLKKKRDETFDK